MLCLSRFPLPAPRVPRCVWRAVPSGFPLPSLAGTPLHAVCAFRALGPVALLVVPACRLRVCALALPRRPLPPLLAGVACAPCAVPALGAGRAVPRGPCPSACPALVPCSVWRAWGGAVRSRFPPTWLGVVGVAVGRPRRGCCLLLRGASGVRRSPFPDCPPTGRAVGVRYPRVVGAGVRVWGPFSVPSACTPLWGLRAARRVRGVHVPGGGLGGGGRAPYPPFVRPGGAFRAGGRSASFRPSAFPGQATKRVSLVSCCPWGAWPPIPLRFVLARLLWARSVRRPGTLSRACLFSAAPVGAGDWGGGAGRAPAPLSGGGGDHPPCLGGWGPGPPRLAGRWGGGGAGGSWRGLSAPILGGGLRYSVLAPVVSSAHSLPACACGPGRGAAPGWGGVRGGPWTAPPGAPADLNPPSALPEWAAVMGKSCRAWPPYCSGAPPCAAPKAWCARCCGTLVWAGPAAATPAGAGGLGRWGARCAGRAASPPPPRVAVPSGGGGGGASPRLQGGGGPLLWLPSWGGGAGGGAGGCPPAPPPRRASACHLLSPACPPGVYSCHGGCRAAAVVGRGSVGRRRASAAGGGGGGGQPWFAPLSSPGRSLIGTLRLRRPGRRRSAVGRQRVGRAGACLVRGAPTPQVQRPLLGGVRGRRFLGLPPSARGPEWEGGGGVGGPSGPLAPPPDGQGGGRHGGPGPGGQPSAGGLHPSPAPLYLEPDPRAGLRWGPSSPLPSSRGAGRPGAAVRVTGQRLAGCGKAGSPPRLLSPPSLSREVARAPASRRTVGGAWVGGPSPPPPLSRVRRLGRHLRRRLCGGWGCGGSGLRRR